MRLIRSTLEKSRFSLYVRYLVAFLDSNYATCDIMASTYTSTTSSETASQLCWMSDITWMTNITLSYCATYERLIKCVITNPAQLIRCNMDDIKRSVG